MWGGAVGRGCEEEEGGGGGVPAPLPACIPTGALGLEPIVYIENLFSAPEWMTNPRALPPPEQIKAN